MKCGMDINMSVYATTIMPGNPDTHMSDGNAATVICLDYYLISCARYVSQNRLYFAYLSDHGLSQAGVP